MEDPKAALQSALKDAMKAKDNKRRDVIRLVQSAIKQVEIDTREELSSEDVMAILQKEAKKRRESIADYSKAGRDDLVEVEEYELSVIGEFLPTQLSEEEVAVIVTEVISEVGATSAKEIGKVMGPVMQRVKGLADGKLVNKIVREKLV